MKNVSLTFAVVSLLLLSGFVLISGCVSGGNEVELGKNNRGTIKGSDPYIGATGLDIHGNTVPIRWYYHVYYLNVEAGRTYDFTLTMFNETYSNTAVGVFSVDKGGFIVQVDPDILGPRGKASYVFEKGGKQEIWVEAFIPPDKAVPDKIVEYSFWVTRS